MASCPAGINDVDEKRNEDKRKDASVAMEVTSNDNKSDHPHDGTDAAGIEREYGFSDRMQRLIGEEEYSASRAKRFVLFLLPDLERTNETDVSSKALLTLTIKTEPPLYCLLQA